ncbi:Uncharacterised protein [Chlamydia trachomatis]|nr:Uncharacterised protein [Chlamydia trachomatis]
MIVGIILNNVFKKRSGIHCVTLFNFSFPKMENTKEIIAIIVIETIH